MTTVPWKGPPANADSIDPASNESFRLPPDTLDAFPRALVESSLEKVLASTVFRRSERHRRFMRYIVQAALDGRRERLKEVLLGIELFDRPLERYDPRTDPIVRVEAGRIREKLARYYDVDGATDAFAFEIPVGSYVPRFERRDRQLAGERTVDSYAVMPFASHGSDEEMAFSVGLADQLINLLGQVPDIKVVARVSAFKLREQKLGINAVGKLLNVSHVIDGSIQRHGNRVRCIAHAYRTKDGMLLWSHAFDSSASGNDANGDVDLFAFQDHIAEAVLVAVSPKSPRVEAVPTAAGAAMEKVTGDRYQARDLFERASYLARRYDTVSSPKVIDLLEQSTALDGGNAAAHVALATAYFHQATTLTAPGNIVLPRIERALARSRAIDPTHTEAIALMAALTLRMHHDWPTADLLFREALRRSPHNSTVNYRYAFGLIVNGEFESGLRHSRMALDLDSLNLGLRAMSAQLLAYSRNYAQAEDEARNVLDLEPDHLYMNYVLGLIGLYRGRYDVAMASFDKVVALYPDHPMGHLVRYATLGLQGEVAHGCRELGAFLARFDGRYCPPLSLALAHHCLGDLAASDAALERAALERDPGLCTLPVDPLFASRHADPAFARWLKIHGMRAPVH